MEALLPSGSEWLTPWSTRRPHDRLDFHRDIHIGDLAFLRETRNAELLRGRERPPASLNIGAVVKLVREIDGVFSTGSHRVVEHLRRRVMDEVRGAPAYGAMPRKKTT